MLSQIKRELSFLIENAAVLGLGAFLCCAGGILLWVNGGSGGYFLRRPWSGIGLTAAFLLWLSVYGLSGASLSMILLAERARLFRGNGAVTAFVLTSASYLLSLIWYALFFCTRLHLFAGILLALSLVLIGMNVVVTRRTFFALRLFQFMTFAVELLFLCGEFMDFL